MPPKDDLVYFGHMFDTARKIVGKAEGLTRARFDADENLRLALLHLVQILGEAARCVSDKGRAAHPDIEWRSITGMRHRIVHDYMDVDEDILFRVATENVPDLCQRLAAFVPADPPIE